MFWGMISDTTLSMPGFSREGVKNGSCSFKKWSKVVKKGSKRGQKKVFFFDVEKHKSTEKTYEIEKKRSKKVTFLVFFKKNGVKNGVQSGIPPKIVYFKKPRYSPLMKCPKMTKKGSKMTPNDPILTPLGRLLLKMH